MPQSPYLEAIMLDALRSGGIENLYQFTCANHISYPHAWQALRRLESRGLVIIERSDGHGRPLVVKGVDIDE